MHERNVLTMHIDNGIGAVVKKTRKKKKHAFLKYMQLLTLT